MKRPILPPDFQLGAREDDRDALQRMLDREPPLEPDDVGPLVPLRRAKPGRLDSYEDDPWQGLETEAAEMARGPSYMRMVVSSVSEPAQGGIINKWTYTLDDGHRVTRYLRKNAQAHTKAACDTCKATAAQTQDEQREELDRMAAKGFGRGE